MIQNFAIDDSFYLSLNLGIFCNPFNKLDI